ncbi:MAG: tyrosine-type recombinase/integrase [Rhizobiaceae bacterium]
MQQKLTKRLVDSLSAAPKDNFLWDLDISGFGLKITPRGRKVYIVQKRLNGRLRRFTIGQHGAPWTPDTARVEANRILVCLSAGIDPGEERRKAEADLTIAELCDLYTKEGCGTKKASTLATDRGRIERHIKPLLGKKKLGQLTRGDLERFLADVANGKTAADVKNGKQSRSIVRGGKGTASRTLGFLGAILKFAVDRGLRGDNPCRGIRRYQDRKIERYLSKQELMNLGRTLVEAEKVGTNVYAIAAVRLLLLTGARKNEILSLKWDWVDFDRSLLRLPDSKTGSKAIPLGDAAIDVLQKIPRELDSPFVFPGSGNEGHLMGLQKIWERIRAKADLDSLRLHDLRHHFLSVGASSGESLYILGKLAGHKRPETTQRYAHLADDPVRQSANRIASTIEASIAESG